MPLNTLEIPQSNEKAIKVRPGDILWRASDEVFWSSPRTLSNPNAIVAFMYIGPSHDGRLVFSAFSISGDDVYLVREGHRHYASSVLKDESFRKSRVTLNVLCNAIKKMNKFQSENTALINQYAKNALKYRIINEVFFTTRDRLGRMAFVKANHRMADIRRWSWASIYSWANWVLNMRFEKMPSAEDIDSYIYRVRELTSSNVKRMFKHRSKTTHPVIARLSKIIQDTVGVSYAIHDGIRWFKLSNAVFEDDYQIIIPKLFKTFAIWLTGNAGVIIFSEKGKPLFITVNSYTVSDQKAVLSIDGREGSSIDVLVVPYSDDLVRWALTKTRNSSDSSDNAGPSDNDELFLGQLAAIVRSS